MNRQGHVELAGQWAMATIVVDENEDDASAEYVLAGDTAA
jgi:hypothetical protein